MEWFKSLVIACSLYSRIPMPRVEWTTKSMRYALCFFPLIGVVVGGGLWVWAQFAQRIPIEALLYGTVGTVWPILVTGGIHMDGFLDVVDARSSHQSRERKLEILKDPHVGAFAVIYGGIYLLLTLGLYSQLPLAAFPAWGGTYVLTRAASGWSVVTFPKARKDGLVCSFSEASHQTWVKGFTAVWAFLALWWMGMFGGVLFGLAAAVVTAVVLVSYYWMSKREFGGVTGDLAGYFLQVCELALLATAIVTIRG